MAARGSRRAVREGLKKRADGSRSGRKAMRTRRERREGCGCGVEGLFSAFSLGRYLITTFWLERPGAVVRIWRPNGSP